MPERALVISLTDLAGDARITRQIGFLAPSYDVVAAAFGPPAIGPEVEFIELPSAAPESLRVRADRVVRPALRNAGLYERAYWRDRRIQIWRELIAAALPVDVVVVNDLYTLPLALSLGPNVAVVFDAREHWTSESASWSWAERLSMRRAHEWIVDQYVPKVDALLTVSPGIAREFEQRTGVHAELHTNAPYFHDLTPSEVHEPIALLHMGVADPRRRLERTIEALGLLDDRFRLDLVLVRDNDYRQRLQSMVEPMSNIRILPPVPVDEVVEFANGYDIGVHLFPPEHPNQVYSLPNKLFDYVQARLAVAIGPSPEMAAIVREWGCGVISETFEPESFAAALAELTPDSVAEMKANSDRAARVLTAETNGDTVLAAVGRALAARRGTRT